MSDTNTPDHGEGEEPAAPDQTDVAAYAPVSSSHLLSDLRVLLAIVGHENPGFPDDRLEDLGFVLEAGDPLEDQAGWILDELPIATETTTTFEVVLGTGGPDRRLCLESDVAMLEASESGSFPIRRIYFRYSWVGAAEVELSGEDREVAEAFARRVVPELEG